ncbi:MAG TPA: hypothetical protein VMR21_00825 [Vicinamibacteria bacterium]|nr:hypothetical protein [Vicinamibacteria bacterium]
MDEGAADDDVCAGMTAGEMRDNVVRLAFGGDRRRYREFCAVLRREIPEGTAAVLRGSAITGVRHSDGAPFDADGPGTSDLDLTIVGAEAVRLYSLDGFFIPKVHSRPVSEKDPDIAPALLPLRERLMRMVGRQVNIQGTRDWIMYLREHLMGQPYLTLVGKVENT